MLTSRLGALERNSNGNQHVHPLQDPRALLPDEPKVSGQKPAPSPTIRPAIGIETFGRDSQRLGAQPKSLARQGSPQSTTFHCTTVDFLPINRSNPRIWDLLGAITPTIEGTMMVNGIRRVGDFCWINI